MKYFDKLFKQLIKEADGVEGIGGAAVPPTGGAGFLGGAAGPTIAGLGANAPAPNLGAATPPPKSNAKPPELTALTSQKKLQLTRLIGLCLKTTINGDSEYVHKLRAMSTAPVVQGDVKKQEEIIIKAVAALQDKELKSILTQIKYIPAEIEDENSTNFISPDEYTSLVSLARAALTTNINDIGGMDRADISVYDITPNNVDDKLKEFKSLLSQTI
jgi:hypothetical protein